MKKIYLLATGFVLLTASAVYAAYPYSSTKTMTTGSTILAADINTSNSDHINNNIPESIDDYSANATEMQSLKDPYSGDAIQLAITLDDELQGLRHVLQAITQETYWYIDPPTFMENSADYDHGTKTLTLSGLLTASSITGTSTVDFGSSAASLEIPNDAAITVDKIGEIGLDTTVTGWHQGFVTYFGTEANYLVSMPTDTMTTTDGHVVAYNAGRDQFEMSAPSGITLDDEEDATNGGANDLTAVTFTSIPSGTKKITIMLVGVSTDDDEELLIQLGDTDGVETSGYVSGATDSGGDAASTAGFIVARLGSATEVYSGSIVLSLEDSAAFTWVSSSNTYDVTGTNVAMGAGHKSLSAELDRVRITSTGTPDDFDAGAINIQYE